jgi:stage II sporulation protein AB (anti-sigma F factor)
MEKRPRNSMKLEFKSLAANVSFARTAVAIFASQMDFTVDQIDEIKVAVSEAVSNAVIHGKKDESSSVYLEALLYDDSLVVIISDDGPGIQDVSWAMEPGTTTADRMGLGFVFIKEYMDELEIDSAPGAGTRVTMIKRLALRVEH